VWRKRRQTPSFETEKKKTEAERRKDSFEGEKREQGSERNEAAARTTGVSPQARGKKARRRAERRPFKVRLEKTKGKVRGSTGAEKKGSKGTNQAGLFKNGKT